MKDKLKELKSPPLILISFLLWLNEMILVLTIIFICLLDVIGWIGRCFGRKSNSANVAKSVASSTHRSGHWCDPNVQTTTQSTRSKQVQTICSSEETKNWNKIKEKKNQCWNFAGERPRRSDMAEPRRPRFRFNDQLWDHQWYMVNCNLPARHFFSLDSCLWGRWCRIRPIPNGSDCNGQLEGRCGRFDWWNSSDASQRRLD